MKGLLIALLSTAVFLGGGMVADAEEGSQCSMELPDGSQTCQVTCKTGWTAYCGRDVEGKRKNWELWCHCKLEPHEVADPHDENGDDNGEEGDDGHDGGEEGDDGHDGSEQGDDDSAGD